MRVAFGACACDCSLPARAAGQISTQRPGGSSRSQPAWPMVAPGAQPLGDGSHRGISRNGGVHSDIPLQSTRSLVNAGLGRHLETYRHGRLAHRGYTCRGRALSCSCACRDGSTNTPSHVDNAGVGRNTPRKAYSSADGTVVIEGGIILVVQTKPVRGYWRRAVPFHPTTSFETLRHARNHTPHVHTGSAGRVRSASLSQP